MFENGSHILWSKVILSEKWEWKGKEWVSQVDRYSKGNFFMLLELLLDDTYIVFPKTYSGDSNWTKGPKLWLKIALYTDLCEYRLSTMLLLVCYSATSFNSKDFQKTRKRCLFIDRGDLIQWKRVTQNLYNLKQEEKEVWKKSALISIVCFLNFFIERK